MQKLIPGYPRKECVIPLRQSRVLEIVQAAHLIVGDFNVGGVLLVTQGALDDQAGLGSRSANEADNIAVIT